MVQLLNPVGVLYPITSLLSHIIFPKLYSEKDSKLYLEHHNKINVEQAF